MADERLPIFLNLPIKHREIIHEPLLEQVNIEKYLQFGLIEKVTCGGESGDNARVCNYDWILNIRSECIKYNVPFYFKQTGANFIKDNKLYKIDRYKQLSQANKANINYLT
jgi:protein gp37